MDLYLLNQNFEIVRYIEGYRSFIWTERYDDHGDATLVFSLKDMNPASFPRKWYLMLDGSDDLMIIKTSEVTYDADEGRVLEVTAKALTSILDQRIVWSQTNLDTNLEPAVKLLLDQNAISPSNSDRRFTNLTFANSGSTVPTVLRVEAQYQGESLYDAISNLCESHDIGFRITHTSRGRFQFQLYGGRNRSYEQNTLAHVVFSPEFDNLENGRYFTSNEDYCNVVQVSGEGNGNKKTFRTISRNVDITGINRFEHSHSASQVSSNNDEIPAAKYRALLDQQGREYLKDHKMKHVYEGETDPTNSFVYGKDYLLGDIVQITDDNIISSPARVVEYIRSDDVGEGRQEFPALRIKED